MSEKKKFYEEMARGCEVEKENEVMIPLDYFYRLLTKVDEFEDVYVDFGIGERNVESGLLSKFCVEKGLCVGNSWFKKKDNRKVTFNGGCSGTKIDFALMKGRLLGVSFNTSY